MSPFHQKFFLDLKQSSAHRLGLGVILITVFVWAIAANVANSLFLVGVQPFELAGASAVIATFGLAVLESLLGRAQARPLNRQQFVLGLILVGLVGADYLAIQQLPVAIAIVLLFTAPIWVVLWSAWAERRMPSRPIIIALILSLLGIILVSNVLTSDLRSVNGFGIVVGLTTALFFAAYIILSERLSTTPETLGVMLKTFAIASLFWLAYQITQGIPQAILAPDNFLKVIYLGLAGNLLPYLLFFWSLQRVPAEQAAIAATLEPLVAGIIAWFWFGQTLTLLQIFGGLLIVVAVTAMQIKTTIAPHS